LAKYQITSEQFLKEPTSFSQCEEHLNNLKNLLCKGKVQWMLKILHWTVDAKNLYFMVLIHF